MTDGRNLTATPSTMHAIRLQPPGGPEELVFVEVETPRLGAGDALVRVRAAAITRGELEWPVDRLPAIPSYELSGVVSATAPDVDAVAIGEPVYALTGFDRDGGRGRLHCGHSERARPEAAHARPHPVRSHPARRT